MARPILAPLALSVAAVLALATSQPVYTVSGEADFTPFTLDAENPASGMSVSITSEGIQGAGECSLQLDTRMENSGIESARVNLWLLDAPWDGESVPVVPSRDTGMDTDTDTDTDTDAYPYSYPYSYSYSYAYAYAYSYAYPDSSSSSSSYDDYDHYYDYYDY